MTLQQPSAKRYAAIMAIVGWTALIVQYYISNDARILSFAENTLRFFSYFTVITNIMVALSYTAVALGANGMLQSLRTPRSLTAVTVYIVMVGAIYNTILISLANLSGLHLIVDRTLHSVIPVSMLLFWIFFVPKAELQWKSAIGWLWYPIVYIIYVIILGKITGFYPYPFANADKLGYPKAILNGVLVTAAFYALSMIFIAIGKVGKKKTA